MAGAAFDRTDILTFSLREFLHSEACPMSPRTPSQVLTPPRTQIRVWLPSARSLSEQPS